MRKVLKAENLTLYVNDNGSRKCLLNDISFHVDDGEMLVITGPNGGGKSTLAKTLIGIEKADSGKIMLNEQDIQIMILIIGQMQESDTHSSSHQDSKECLFPSFLHWQQEEVCQLMNAVICLLQ